MKTLSEYIKESDQEAHGILYVHMSLISKGFEIVDMDTFDEYSKYLHYCLLRRGSEYALIVGGRDHMRIHRDKINYTVYFSNKHSLNLHDDPDLRIVQMNQDSNWNSKINVNYNEYQERLLKHHNIQLPIDSWYTLARYLSKDKKNARYYNLVLHEDESNIDRLTEKIDRFIF